MCSKFKILKIILDPAWQYLEDNIFPTLVPLLEKTLIKAIQMNCLKVNTIQYNLKIINKFLNLLSTKKICSTELILYRKFYGTLIKNIQKELRII